MKPSDFTSKYGFELASEGDNRKIEGIYCCDLLSMVMGRAKENDALITVMGNVNTVAVGVLADVSCIILCEGIKFDDESLKKAKDQDICVIYSDKSSFETALLLAKELKLA